MPNSMDISAYEKVPFLENLEDGTTSTTSTTSRSDEGDTSVAVLSRSMLSRPSPHVNVVRSPWMFLLDLGLVILVLIFAVRKSHVNGVQLQGDVTGFVPQFDHEITTFRAHPEFVSNHTSIESLQIAQKAWTEFLPRGQGYLSISDQDMTKFDLPDPVEYQGTQSLGTSWMHGLHCLYLVMSEYDMLAMGMRQPGYDTWHMDHCIDYIRQLIICSGDMALAGGDLPGGSSFLNVPHVCKSYDKMHSYLEDHRDNDAFQFGNHESHYVPP